VVDETFQTIAKCSKATCSNMVGSLIMTYHKFTATLESVRIFKIIIIIIIIRQ